MFTGTMEILLSWTFKLRFVSNRKTCGLGPTGHLSLSITVFPLNVHLSLLQTLSLSFCLLTATHSQKSLNKRAWGTTFQAEL